MPSPTNENEICAKAKEEVVPLHDTLQHNKATIDVFVERPEHDIHYKTLDWQVRS
jgi:hypothetical protein